MPTFSQYTWTLDFNLACPFALFIFSSEYFPLCTSASYLWVCPFFCIIKKCFLGTDFFFFFFCCWMLNPSEWTGWNLISVGSRGFLPSPGVYDKNSTLTAPQVKAALYCQQHVRSILLTSYRTLEGMEWTRSWLDAKSWISLKILVSMTGNIQNACYKSSN